MSGKVVRHSLA